jgi:DNA-binding MarR family transcriptional regulator
VDDFDIDGLDEVIHGRVRLGVMAWLVGHEQADFNDLKARLKLTDGNLSAHLRKLEDAGYVGLAKSFVDRKSLTRVRLTDGGRRAFIAYLAAMERLVADTRSTEETTSS